MLQVELVENGLSKEHEIVQANWGIISLTNLSSLAATEYCTKVRKKGAAGN